MPFTPNDPHPNDMAQRSPLMREAVGLTAMLAIYCAGLALLAALAWYGWQMLMRDDVFATVQAAPKGQWIVSDGQPALRGGL